MQVSGFSRRIGCCGCINPESLTDDLKLGLGGGAPCRLGKYFAVRRAPSQVTQGFTLPAGIPQVIELSAPILCFLKCLALGSIWYIKNTFNTYII